MNDGTSQNPWPPSVEELGREISDFQILESTGFDACGAVYTARDTGANRVVTLRVLPPGATGTPDFSGRFSREMAIASAVRHPNLAGVLGSGVTTGGWHFLVTEFVEGHDLGSIVKSGTVTIEHADGWMPQLLGALEAIHTAGTFHGWLNATQVRIEPGGNAKLAGFGLANLSDVFGGAAAMNAVSLAFVAPECSRGGVRGDYRADLYAVGVLLYQMLTGEIPHGIFHPPSQVVAGLEPRYDAAVAAALEGNPSLRFQSAAVFRETLVADLSGNETAGTVMSPARAALPAVPSRPPLETKGRPMPARRERKTAAISPPPEKDSSLGFYSLMIATVVIVGAGVFFLKGRSGKNQEERVEAPVADERSRLEGTILEYLDEPDPFGGGGPSLESAERKPLTEAGKLLIELRQLAPYDPKLAEEIRSDKNLAIFVATAEFIESMGESPLKRQLTNRGFLRKLRDLREQARFPPPVRNSQTGSLLTWPADGDSEPESASNFLSDYSGPAERIVEIAGNLDAGVALTALGEIATWGSSVKAPDLKGIAAVDCEEGHFAALLESGRVSTWGVLAEGESEAVASWEKVCEIEAGSSHLLAITEDFKLLSAGSNRSGQVEFPGSAGRGRIVAIAAEGDRSAALSADGTLFLWGGIEKPDEKSLPVLFDIEFFHGKLIGVTRGGRVIGGLEEWRYDPIDLAGSGGGIREVPRMSPDGDQFALRRSGSRWLFSGIRGVPGRGFDPLICEKNARGAIDLILGSDRVLAVAPSQKTRKELVGPKLKGPPLPMTTIDDVTVPSDLFYREWTVKGVKKRARLLAINDESHALLRFADGTGDQSVALDRFVARDRAFAAEWKGKELIEREWLNQEIAGLTMGAFLSGSGFVGVEFDLGKRGPMIEGIAGSLIESRPVRMLVDTGASKSALNLSMARRLGLLIKPEKGVRTWQGIIPAGTTNLKSLRLGDAILDNLEVLVIDLNRVGQGGEFDGILGIDVLRKADAAFDFGMMKLLFRNPAGIDEMVFRDWNNTKGESIRAKIYGNQGAEAGMVSFIKPSGEKFEIPSSTLSAKDREYVDLYGVLQDHRESRRQLRLGDYLAFDPGAWEIINYKIQNNQQILNVQVEGRDLQFFVDTGAARSMISKDSAIFLGRRIESLPKLGYASGLEGMPTVIYGADLRTIQMGSRSLFDFRISVYDFRHMSQYRSSGTAHGGVLGVDLLERFEAIIDHDTKRIILPVSTIAGGDLNQFQRTMLSCKAWEFRVKLN